MPPYVHSDDLTRPMHPLFDTITQRLRREGARFALRANNALYVQVADAEFSVKITDDTGAVSVGPLIPTEGAPLEPALSARLIHRRVEDIATGWFMAKAHP